MSESPTTSAWCALAYGIFCLVLVTMETWVPAIEQAAEEVVEVAERHLAIYRGLRKECE